MNSLAKTLHLYGNGTEKDSTEVMASHKRHCCKYLHLCNEKQFHITSLVTHKIIQHRRQLQGINVSVYT